MSAEIAKMDERAFQAAVLDLARLLGWKCFHTFDSRRSEPGWPDLVLVRDRVLFVELKSATGTLTIEQQDWLHALKAAGQDVDVWRPAQWLDGTIERRLQAR